MHRKQTHHTAPNPPFPDFDPNYPLDEVDDNLKQLDGKHGNDATPQGDSEILVGQRPISCKQIELPTTEHARRRAGELKSEFTIRASYISRIRVRWGVDLLVWRTLLLSRSCAWP